MTTKLPPAKHAVAPVKRGDWLICPACSRSWKVGAKVTPRCAPRKPQTVYY